jgi:two-component system LytT family response regulator
MQKIKCIIIEDEPFAVKLLSGYIQQAPHLELRGTFEEAVSAGHHLQKEKIDFIFLDIHLPRLKGLSFLRTLANPPYVIVTTAYHQYAVEGFELNVTDYLMKPFSFERFIAAVNKVSRLVLADLPAGEEKLKNETSLFLTIDRKKVRIDYDNILYIESQREYVKVVTLNGEYVSKISTTELESLLPKSKLIRVHRSFIVSIEKIDTFTKVDLEINGKTIPIGKGYRGELLFKNKQ